MAIRKTVRENDAFSTKSLLPIKYRRRHLAAALIAGLSIMLCGVGPLAGGENEPTPAGWTVEEMMQVKGVGDVRVSPDGSRVVYTVTEAVMTDEKSEYLTHIHMARTEGTGSYQFTHGEKSCSDPQWSPDGATLAFSSKRSGKSNIWLIRTDGGEARQLTDSETGVNSFAWSPRGGTIAFVMADPKSEEKEKAEKGKDDARVVDKDLTMSHLWVISTGLDKDKKHQARRLTGGGFNVNSAYAGGFDWSADGRTIVFTHTPNPGADHWPLADISTVDVETGEVSPFLNTSASEHSPLYSPDGKLLAFLRSDDPPSWGFTSDVHIVDAAGGEPRPLTHTFDRQARLVGWSADGKKIYFTETRGTVTRLSELPLDGSPAREINRQDHVLGSFNLNASRNYFGFTLQTATDPVEACVSRLDRFNPVKVSRANAKIADHPLGSTELLVWKSDDGMEIEGLLTYPVGYEEGKKYPLLLVIHGGPMGVFTRSFIANPSPYPIAVFASEGFAVLRCNIRGSSGYGRQFRYANYDDWGGMDYRDLMTGVDHLIDTGLADPERLGVMGWSYGGYMSSWIITRTDRFKAASIGAPVTNLMSFNGTTDIPGFIPDFFHGEFWERFDAYRDHSAMFNIGGVTTPTMIQHGESDVRVPFSQGMELYTALKRQGVEVQMVAYPRAGHGLGEPKHRLDAAKRNLEWFKEHLLEK